MDLQRLQISIKGQVQGVGFRPHVYRVACALHLTGLVKNDLNGVLLEIQGARVSDFLPALKVNLPPLALIKSIDSQVLPAQIDETHFMILESESGNAFAMISPDTSPCEVCLNELEDSQSRYYQYPFVNCTQCGPRFTITHDLPYDRAKTAMCDFALCEACCSDYTNPMNRRFHAEPTACAKCGPKLSTSIDKITAVLTAGGIVALKGVGGYQLLCDAKNDAAIARLRVLKGREKKPFALMVLNTESAKIYVDIDAAEKKVLESRARPIVLLKKKEAKTFENIAPSLSHLGIMLPSSPLHYLLFKSLELLVVTSANLNGAPLITDDDEVESVLKEKVDLIASYNRKIITRADDSVLRVINQSPMLIRRARGFVPEAIALSHAMPSTIGLGGQFKNTFCITRNDEAFVSQHIGSLTHPKTIEFFHESLNHWLRFLNVKPERLAIDNHPDFYTAKWAHAYDLPVIGVFHHHAHIASVMAEHQLTKPVLGLALDGYGYGVDGGAWGGELLRVAQHDFKRLSSMKPLYMIGGELAAREPWRMAVSVLYQLGKLDEILKRFGNMAQLQMLLQLLESKALALTSSCGRWFDAASAVLGVNCFSSYEGEAAMQLESLVTRPKVMQNGFSFENNQFNLLSLFEVLLKVSPKEGANLFHGTLIAGLSEWVLMWSKKTNLDAVVLGGGCFLNQVLAEGLSHALQEKGLQVYLPRRLPPNDGGLSLGQAWVAGNVVI